MRDFGACETELRDKKIVLRDEQSRSFNSMIFNNLSQKPVRKILIDDCVIKKGIRCDYLLIANAMEHFVELKGNKVEHAIEQIEQTIKQVSEDRQQQPKWCFVISSRCPLLTTKIQEIKLRFKKRYNAIFVIKNNRLEHDL
jgi:hypothetical protein